ncbi:hypothetical protein SXCC_01434 [Gluconacetobacter sp. SXCC-1]|nr:hypothetical protein SXCC_01434 [Gluconacetobacter sp. SXCC-1]
MGWIMAPTVPFPLPPAWGAGILPLLTPECSQTGPAGRSCVQAKPFMNPWLREPAHDLASSTDAAPAPSGPAA